jgi:hypothetical protein
MKFLIEMKYWFAQGKEVFDAAFAPPPPTAQSRQTVPLIEKPWAAKQMLYCINKCI